MIEIANQKNGHDNSTIALFYCQVQVAPSRSPITYQVLTSQPSEDLDQLDTVAVSEFPTQPSYTVRPRVTSPTPFFTPVETPVKSPKSALLPLLLGGLGLLTVITGFYVWRNSFSTVESTPLPSSTSVLTLEALTSGQVLKTTREITLQSATTTNNAQVIAPIPLPPDSIIKVIEAPLAPANVVKLEVCSPMDFQSMQGEIAAEQLQSFAIVAPDAIGQCPTPAIPSPSPTPSN